MNLYIHIPFCASKCSYCHFYSVCNSHQLDDYVKALINEIDQRLTKHIQIDTIYFGGGTPSLLSPKQLEKIVSKLNFSRDTEVTLEAHPNTLSKSKLTDFQTLGVNRLSIGIQSWNEKILTAMGRTYDRIDLIKIIEFAQSHSLQNINIDHIISYPFQTDQMIKQDISTSVSLNPTHISIYPLERHPKTRIKKSPPTHKIIRQFAEVQRILIKQSYRHYEELNYSKPGFMCRHNVDFWRGKDYLGFGPSAVSKINNEIIENSSNIDDYLNRLLNREHPLQFVTTITPNQNKQLEENLSHRLL